MRIAEHKGTEGEGSPYARHIPALDGIRGLAILGVMGTHLFLGTRSSLLTRAVAGVLDFGAHGVDLFFVLSGFLITGILYESQNDRGFFRKFYARRALRIFPLYYGVLALFAVWALVRGISFHGELLSLALYLQNTSLIAMPISLYSLLPALPLVHFWTLAVEEQFYLVWPLVVFYAGKRKRVLALCCFFIVFCPALRLLGASHGIDYYHRHISTIFRADALLMGGALAMLLRGRMHDRVLRAATWTFWIALTVGVLPEAMEPHLPVALAAHLVPWRIAFDDTALATASAALLAMSLRPGVAKTAFNNSVMRWIGRYSYGIYVIHYILFAWLQVPLRVVMGHFTGSKGAIVVLTGLLVGALSMVLAYASYHLFEVRFLHLKKHFDYKRSA